MTNSATASDQHPGKDDCLSNDGRTRTPSALDESSQYAGPTNLRNNIRVSITVGARVIFWPLALLTLVMLAMQLGAWRKDFNIAGPFAAETSPARHSLIVTVPKEGRTPWWRQPLIGDTLEKPLESNLELRIDGREMGPPHTLHETIQEGTTAGFSHWGPDVIFSLPPGVKNTSETIATLRYTVRPRPWVPLTLIISSALVGWLLLDPTLTLLARGLREFARSARRRAEGTNAAVVRAPYLMLFALCGLGLIASVVYAAASFYALATGWALPTTALIRWSPIAQWAARNEPYLGYLLLMCTGFGVLVTWLGSFSLQHRRTIESHERMLWSLLRWCGFPITLCAFVFCMSAMWAGMVRPGDFDYANIGGLVPYSDAVAYLAAAHDQVKDGTWVAFAQRRPLASAFRSVILFFGCYSLPIMLTLQACLLAAATCFAAYAVVMWRGVWAGIAFFGLTYIYTRTFVPTTLTEPLGLFWALLSVPFFVEVFRSGSVKPALIALAMTAIALMTRMGSMFTIPALLVWLLWQFGNSMAAKLRIGVAAAAVLIGVLGTNTLLQKAYGSDQGSTGSNFSYVLCGLTIGTGWEGCPKKLAAEGVTLAGNEAVVAGQLYSMAWANFRAKPEIPFGRLADGAQAFVSDFPDVIWRGYLAAITEPDWLFRNALTTISLMGLVYILARRAKSLELTFWALLWLSIVASSSMIYFDDGPRALASSHPLMALFFAVGMSSPEPAAGETLSRSRLSPYGSIGLIVAALLVVGVPWIAHRFRPTVAIEGDRLISKRDEAFVFGGRRMPGFLVVEDGLPLRSDVPTLHLADFQALVAQSGVELDQGLLHPVTPPLPFGFVFAPRVEKGSPSSNQFIVPADVMERRDVPAWHFKLEPWQHKPNAHGNYWFYVTKAEPWPG